MVDLSKQVAVVTGAGGGLGRAHAKLLAGRGARVVVNDVMLSQAEAVAEEISVAGGTAMAIPCSVTDVGSTFAMIERALALWGRIDILVNNAGILRDKTFAKMELADFREVIEVHLMGAVHCTKAVWEPMRKQNFGRIVMTTSSSGLFGNFGQSNYGAAKMALVGLMQTLALEGRRYDIRVNCLAPTAATRMMEGLISTAEFDQLRPDLVSPGLLALVHRDAPTRTILCAGAGSFETAHITLTRGVYIGDASDAAERLIGCWDQLVDRANDVVPETAGQQRRAEIGKAEYSMQVK